MKVVHPGERKYLKALIFGPSGHGKTHFVGTAQEDERTSPLLLLDFEGGDQTLVGLPVDMVQIRDWDDYREVYTELVEGKTKYKSIGIDSISETHIFALLDILEKESRNRRDEDMLQQQDYGKATIQMRRLLRSFRDLPMHVFFTAGAKEIVEAKVGAVKVPSLSGQLAEEVPGLMDLSGYLSLTKETLPSGQVIDQRTLLLKNVSQFRVKVRTGWNQQAPDYLDDPTVGKLLDLLQPTPQVQPQLVSSNKEKK